MFQIIITILLVIIAVGVLLMSEEGKKFLKKISRVLKGTYVALGIIVILAAVLAIIFFILYKFGVVKDMTDVWIGLVMIPFVILLFSLQPEKNEKK